MFTLAGKVMRITIPKSQGKQPFYDARKSSWGDLFPHEPKNAPQERYQPTRTSKKEGGTTPVKGEHIGKRYKKEKVVRTSYASLADDLKEKKKQVRKKRLRAMNEDVSF
jgi:ribosomal protein RSM22 (predicted rRNA methylase)